MSGRSWRSADYSQGRINGSAVVLIRGHDFYPEWLTTDDLPWRVHVTCVDMDDARKIAKLLNDNKENTK